MKTVNLIFTLLLVLVSIITSCNNDNKQIIKQYSSYFQKSDSLISQMSTGQKSRRDTIISKIKKTDCYKRLVINKEINTSNLNLLHIINSAIINSSPNGISLLADEESSLNSDELRFTTLVSVLCLPENGGITPELLSVFIRYRNELVYYANKGSQIINKEGNKTYFINNNFDISPIFILVEPTNKKALDAVKLSRYKGIREWSVFGEDNTQYYMPYLKYFSSYLEHLKTFYPDSPFFYEYRYNGTSASLVKEFLDNGVLAYNKYNDVGISLKGTVTGIFKDVDNNNIITLNGSRFLSGVHCRVAEKDAVKVSKGQSIEVLGKCKGIKIGFVLLDLCELKLSL